MPKVSEAHLAGRQGQILDAAVRAFARGGFHATGMADVIRESGLSAGSVYRYYKGKDDLIAAIVDRLLGTLHARLLDLGDADTPAELLRGALGVSLRTMADPDLPYARLLPQVWTEALRHPAIQERVQATYGRIIEHFRERARDMQARGTLAPDLDPRGVGHVLLSAVQGFVLQKLLLAQDLDPDVYAAAAARMYEYPPR